MWLNSPMCATQMRPQTGQVKSEGDDKRPLAETETHIPSWHCCTMLINFAGQPSLDNKLHKAGLLVSKAFVRL